MSGTYTSTLISGYTLVVSTEADFGQIIIAALLLSLAAVMALELVFKLAYRK